MLNENVLYSYPKTSSASGLCQYCEKPLGFRLFNRSRFCSEEHASAEKRRLQLMMAARLRDSTQQLRTAFIEYEKRPKALEPQACPEKALAVIPKH